MSPLARKARTAWDLHREGRLGPVLRRVALRSVRSPVWALRSRLGAEMTVKVAPGVSMRLRFDDRLGYLIYADSFELSERGFIARFLRRGDVFVDVGANIGLFTVIAAHLVGSEGAVYAFEPATPVFDRLRRNIALNRLSNVHPECVAISDVDEARPMVVVGDGFAAWSTLGNPIGDAAGARRRTDVVRCVKLDGYLRSARVGHVDLMKVDVEGWESHVLRGAGELLGNPEAPALLVEFSDAAAQSAGSSCAGLREALESLGYGVFRYDSRAARLLPEPHRASYAYSNLVAVKNLQAAERRLLGSAETSARR